MKREDLYGDTDKLLFDILQELKKLNGGKPEVKAAGLTAGIPCKYCGGVHENKGQVMACAKKLKRKKEGAKQ